MLLHWSPKSPYVRKVMVCAHELELLPRLQLQRSVAAMRVPNEALMRHNPLSKIPTLVCDDGTVLFDSVVICEYLDSIVQGPLFPYSGAARWQALCWQALGDGLLDVLILWRNERERDVPLAALMAAFERKTMAALQLLDSQARVLSQSHFCIGHIAVGCALGYLDYRFETLRWRDEAPQLAVWLAGLQARPSFRATEPAEG